MYFIAATPINSHIEERGLIVKYTSGGILYFYTKGWDFITVNATYHTHAFTMLNQTNHLSTKSNTYYRAPGLAVKELVPVRQIESGNTEQNRSSFRLALG